MINELARYPTRLENVYFANNEQPWIAVFTAVFCFTHLWTDASVQKKQICFVRFSAIIWGNSRGIKNYFCGRTIQNFKWKVAERQTITVQFLFCIFGYFLSLLLSHWSTNPYEIRGTTSSSSLHWDGKRSLNRHNIQLLVIYVWAIFVLKMYEISARNFSVKSTICSSQTFYHLISFLSTFYQP